MSRTKKRTITKSILQTDADNQVKPTQAVLEPKTTLAQNGGKLYYSGEVTITVRHGEKAIKTITCHNHGGISLFSFLLSALGSSSFSAINTLRPAKLMVLSTDTWYRPTEEDKDWQGWSDTTLTASNSIGYNKRPKPSDDSDNNYSCSFTLHFMVPYTALAGGGTIINGFLLLSNSGADTGLDSILTKMHTSEQAFAKPQYFAFLPVQEELKIDTGDTRKNFNLLIDWTLTFENAVTQD